MTSLNKASTLTLSSGGSQLGLGGDDLMGKDVSSQHPDVEDADVITVDDAMSSGWPGEFTFTFCLHVFTRLCFM